MLKICLKGKGTVFKGPKIPNSSEGSNWTAAEHLSIEERQKVTIHKNFVPNAASISNKCCFFFFHVVITFQIVVQ